MKNQFMQHVFSVAQHDIMLFRRFPRLRLAVLGVLFVPALYALIYLSSVWDPNARTSQLPVGIVQEDTGTLYREHEVKLGADLVTMLEHKQTFKFITYPDPESVKQAVRNGTLVFALIIPKDFSLHAVPGREAGGGKLVIYTSEGNSYTGAGFAKRFAPELAHQINETLNEKRWSLVLETAAGSAQSLDALRNGMAQLQQGAGQLADGLKQAQSGSQHLAGGLQTLAPAGTQLSEGFKQFSNGIRQINAKLPSNEQLKELRNGASALAQSETELSDGLEKLHGGAGKLAAGTAELKTRSADIPIVGAKIAAGAAELENGANQLVDGLQKARDGQVQITNGAKRLDAGVSTLTDGLSQLGAGIGAMSAQAPENRALDSFAAGLSTAAKGSNDLMTGLGALHEGAARLNTGIVLINDSLPKTNPALDGSAQGLAMSVEPTLEIVAPVATNGTGFAANFVPLALWVGAVMSAFIFHFRRVPLGVAETPRFALIIGKMFVPAMIVMAQSFVMLMMLLFLLDIQVPSIMTFGLTLTVASLAFLAIVFALVRIFGDSGKVVAVLLLILQLSSAGALMPIELTSRVFQTLHPFLPFSWVVKAFRASLFGAYDGAWLLPWSVIILAGIAGLVISNIVGKWKVVTDDDYTPAIDVH